MRTLVVLVSVFVLSLAACDLIPPPELYPGVSRCTMSAGLSCVDFMLEDGELTLVLQNGLGREIDIREVRYQVHDGSESVCMQPHTISLPNAQSTPITFENCVAEHDTRYRLAVEYTLPDSTMSTPRVIEGELFIAS